MAVEVLPRVLVVAGIPGSGKSSSVDSLLCWLVVVVQAFTAEGGVPFAASGLARPCRR